MKRRKITKILIASVFFLLLLLYSYMQANMYVSNFFSQFQQTSPRSISPALVLPRISCNSLFSGKTLFIIGVLSVPLDCFVYNESTLLYAEANGFGIIYINGSIEQPAGVVLSFPTNLSVSIGSTSLRIVRTIIVIYQSSFEANFSLVKHVLEQHKLRDDFCLHATFSMVQGNITIAERLYKYVCS